MSVPAITIITDDFGSAGTVVQIEGTGFTGVTDVTFDGVSSGYVNFIDDNTVLSQAPAGPSGVVEVTVTNPDGSSPHSAGSSWTYESTPPPVAIADGCITVAVPDFLADGATADANGIVYTPTLVGGWWDSIPLTSATAEVQPRGETITVAQELGREIALEITAHSPDAGVPLGPILCFTAMETIKAAFRTVFVPSTFRVLDPFADRTLLARRVGPIKQTILGDSAVVQSSIPLLAEDPRRLPT